MKIDLNRQMQEVFEKKTTQITDYSLCNMVFHLPYEKLLWSKYCIENTEKFEKVKHTSLQKEKKGYKWGRGEFKEKWGNRK